MTTQEIENGMKLLDEKALELPEIKDWRLLINKNELDMEECSVCVLGQLFGKYWNGLAKIGLLQVPEEASVMDAYIDNEDIDNIASEFGFSLRDNEEGWKELTNQWKQALSERQHDNQS